MKYFFPQSFSILELSNSNTYIAHENLTRLCRRNIAPTLNMPIGEAKRKLIRGEFPLIVKPIIDHLHTIYNRLLEELIATQDKLPVGYKLESNVINNESGAWAVLRPPKFNKTLHLRIRRIGGHWEGDKTSHQGCWIIPLDKLRHIPYILSNPF